MGALLLAGIALGELGLFIFLSVTHRIPFVHDTFQYFNLQYYFLNNSANAGEIPHWIPYMLNGTVATWWQAVQASPFQQVLTAVGPLLKGADLLPFFYASLWVDELIIIIGTWLLATRFFSSRSAVFFVTLAVAGSTVWTSQPWFNLHFASAIPLLLYLLHRFLETGRWRHLLLAGNLLTLQMLGNLPYALPMTTFILFVYFALYGLCNPSLFQSGVKKLRWGPPALACCAVTLISLGAALLFLRAGMDQTVQYNPGRNPDGTVPLHVFLHYGGNQHWEKWAEVIFGLSPCLDYTLYVGTLAVLLAWVAVVLPQRRHLHFLLAIGILVAVSMGTRPAEWVYYGWPMMKFFRHLGLTTGPVKLFLCFLAGSGLDSLNRRSGSSPMPLVRRLLCVIPMLALCAILLTAASHPVSVADFLERALVDNPRLEFPPTLYTGFIQQTLTLVLATALIGTFCIGKWLWSGPGFKKKFLVTLLLGIQLMDLYSYRLWDILSKTLPLNPAERTLTRQQALPFRKQRAPLLKSNSGRLAAISRFRFWSSVPESLSLLLFLDEPGSSFRTDYLQRPFDQFIRTYLGFSLSSEDDDNMSSYLFHYRLVNPLRHPAALKISGVTEDKIQFFSRAAVGNDEPQVASFIRLPNYSGNSPVLLEGGTPPITLSPPLSTSFDPISNSRLSLPYRIERFDSNHLALSVDVPGRQPIWMLYSDVWHPAWKATVSGKPVPVYRANLAYKAVPLGPGLNSVHFSFRLPLLFWLQRIFVLNILAWAGVLGALLRRVNSLTGQEEETREGKAD